MKLQPNSKTHSKFRERKNRASKMSENNPESFPINDVVDYAVNINIANRWNGQQMEQMFQALVDKTEEYRNRYRSSDARVESLKNVIVAQWQEINRLRDKLDKVSKKLELAESMAQTNEIKYNRIYNKLKAIVLDSAADSCANDNNNNT